MSGRQTYRAHGRGCPCTPCCAAELFPAQRQRDQFGDRASYWLTRAAAMLDDAIQCCGTEDSEEISAMERRCDELSAMLREQGW